MKIAVLGGAGLTGSCAVRALAESKDVDEGLVLDLDADQALSVSDALGKGKFSAKAVDVTDVDATARLIKGYDVVVNAVQYYFNLDVMSAALKAKANYLDFGGLYHVTLRQLKLDSEFRSRNLTALVGMGGEPGITNVLSRMGADSMERVSSIHIRDGGRDFTSGLDRFVVTWSLDTFLDELVLDAPIFEGGRMKNIPALSRKETVVFPPPVGTMDTFVTIHSEVATLPRSFGRRGLRDVDWMEGTPEILGLKLLADLGLASNEERQFGPVAIAPRKFLMSLVKSRGQMGYPESIVPDDWEATRVTMSGRLGGKDVTKVYDVTIPPRPEWKMSCARYAVGIPGSIGARMIGRGDIAAKGVVPPELCVNPSRFLSELMGYGFRVRETVQEERA